MTDIRCGTEKILRATNLTALVEYDADPAHAGCSSARFTMPTIISTTQGQWQFRSGSERRIVDARLLIAGNAGDEYACRHAQRYPNKALAVRLKPGAIAPEFALFEERVVNAGGLSRLFARLREPLTDDEFDSLVFTIFGEASALSTASKDRALTLRIERAKRFLEQHAFDRVSLGDLGRELGLSPYTAIRQFKAATGKTPHSYTLEVRLDAAMQMLRRTNASVESVAKQVGFDDLAYFSRFFKRRTGQSPSRFRAA